jgi:hypothetical protein
MSEASHGSALRQSQRTWGWVSMAAIIDELLDNLGISGIVPVWF